MPDSSRPSRTPLQVAVSLSAIGLAIFSGLDLVVPLLLFGAIWWLVQRSHRADRRWIATAFAYPAGFLVWKLVGALVLKNHSLGLPELAILAGPLLWLLLWPGKTPLMLQIGFQGVLVFLFCRFLASFPLAAWGQRGVHTAAADLYFCVATVGASIFALRRGPEASAVLQPAG